MIVLKFPLYFVLAFQKVFLVRGYSRLLKCFYILWLQVCQ